jgi:hypothetical protein
LRILWEWLHKAAPLSDDEMGGEASDTFTRDRV